MFYFDKNDPRVLFQDIRQVSITLCDGQPFEVNPDVLGDFRNMEFPDGTFNMVVFDPPHLLWNTGKSKFADIYGSLNPKAKPAGWQCSLFDNWREVLADGFSECFRVLKPGGFLIFKWNETDIPVREVLKLTDHKSGKRSNTHWLCFMKENI